MWRAIFTGRWAPWLVFLFIYNSVSAGVFRTGGPESPVGRSVDTPLSSFLFFERHLKRHWRILTSALELRGWLGTEVLLEGPKIENTSLR